MNIKLFNSDSKTIENFTPEKNDRVTMYVCGPTVYERPHIGNARSVVVYDVLYRLLTETFGQDKVIYVRNITDVDDKINIAATERKVSIQDLTREVHKQFHDDIEALNCLLPNIEPKATEHIPEMISIIEGLINSRHAYVSNNHVYFKVSSFDDYGSLARKETGSLIAGSRIKINQDKEAPEDFVLWKPSKDTDDKSSVFQSPWGPGRPGWHIECSAMSTKYLGANFDIHGGGIDLIFPHHTNEVAQSCCYNKESRYAKYWIHNGFVTVSGEKMSKSLGNVFTVHDLLNRGIQGEVIRFIYLSTHYRKPLNWTEKSVSDSKKTLDSFYRVLINYELSDLVSNEITAERKVQDALHDDMNVPLVISFMHEYVKDFNKSQDTQNKLQIARYLYKSGTLLGLFYNNPKSWFQTTNDTTIEKMVTKRTEAKQNKNWALADEIRNTLEKRGIILEDHTDGTTTWRNRH